MFVLAHRGIHDRAPENSMAAFAAAVAAGADGIETDVRLSRDGVAVLVHDAKIGRRRVAAMTHAEIARACGHPVPSLAEALRRFDVLWDVEIKSADAVDAVIAVLRRHAGRRRFFVTSFRRDVLARVAASGVADTGPIAERAPLVRRGPPGNVVVWKLPVCTRRRVRAARARGARVYVYGPRTAADHARCVALGVDGIITDHVARARAAVRGAASTADTKPRSIKGMR